MSQGDPFEAPHGYSLRRLQIDSPGELDLIVSSSMKTVLDTIVELEGSEERARQLIPNFSHAQMRAMYARDLERPDSHQFVVAATEAGEIAGHAIYFLRPPDPHAPTQAAPSGYLFTLYVDPSHRKRGVASSLMNHMISWLEARGAALIEAHTHVTNAPLIGLATRHGFAIVSKHEKPWPHFLLRRTTAERRS